MREVCSSRLARWMSVARGGHARGLHCVGDRCVARFRRQQGRNPDVCRDSGERLWAVKGGRMRPGRIARQTIGCGPQIRRSCGRWIGLWLSRLGHEPNPRTACGRHDLFREALSPLSPSAYPAQMWRRRRQTASSGSRPVTRQSLAQPDLQVVIPTRCCGLRSTPEVTPHRADEVTMPRPKQSGREQDHLARGAKRAHRRNHGIRRWDPEGYLYEM